VYGHIARLILAYRWSYVAENGSAEQNNIELSMSSRNNI
jgi:hypothetical protein